MASLSVRRIDDDVYKRLRIRAAEHGVSMEEEVRQILSRAVAAPEHLGDLALKLFGESHGATIELPDHEAHEPMKLE